MRERASARARGRVSVRWETPTILARVSRAALRRATLRHAALRRAALRHAALRRASLRRAAPHRATLRRSALRRTIGIVAVCATTVARMESATGCETMISPTSPRASSEPKKAATSAGGIFASTTRKFAPAASRCPMPASKKPVTVSSAGGASGGARATERKRASARAHERKDERVRTLRVPPSSLSSSSWTSLPSLSSSAARRRRSAASAVRAGRSRQRARRCGACARSPAPCPRARTVADHGDQLSRVLDLGGVAGGGHPARPERAARRLRREAARGRREDGGDDEPLKEAVVAGSSVSLLHR